MHPHCQVQIDERNDALKAYRRVRLLQDYAKKRKDETGTAWWAKQLDVLGPYAARLGSTNNKKEKALQVCLLTFGGSDLVTDPGEEQPPTNDGEFDQCMLHAPNFTGDWL